MKIAICFLAVILLAGVANGQSKAKAEPLILRGRLINSPEKILKIGFTDENNIRVLDTIRLDNEGRFYLKTYRIKNPQVVSIQQKPRRSIKYLWPPVMI